MRRLVVILFFLIASVWLGVELARHPGYALFNFGQWVIELPLWLAILGLLFSFLLLHSFLRLIAYLQDFSGRFSHWWAERRQNKAHDKTNRGLLEMLEEQWSSAERHLLAGIAQTKSPVINYLAAAEAAFAQKAYERCDKHLQKAHQVAPADEVVIGLVQARLQFEQGQLEQTLATLNHLQRLAPYHPAVLKLLEKMYIRLADWPQLLKLVPVLRKAKVINSSQALLFEKNIHCELLNEAEHKNMSIHAVRELWHAMPKKMRLHPDVLERYARLLKEDKESAEELEPLIRKILRKEWHENLAKVYGSLTTSDPKQQLEAAESWVKQYGKRGSILLTLGKLCERCQLWGKARHYFEEGLKQELNSETQLELAKLLEYLGETQLALRHYKDGLELATST